MPQCITVVVGFGHFHIVSIEELVADGHRLVNLDKYFGGDKLLSKGISCGVGKGQSLFVPFGYAAVLIGIPGEIDHEDSEYKHLVTLTHAVLDEPSVGNVPSSVAVEVKTLLSSLVRARLAR